MVLLCWRWGKFVQKNFWICGIFTKKFLLYLIQVVILCYFLVKLLFWNCSGKFLLLLWWVVEFLCLSIGETDEIVILYVGVFLLFNLIEIWYVLLAMRSGFLVWYWFWSLMCDFIIGVNFLIVFEFIELEFTSLGKFYSISFQLSLNSVDEFLQHDSRMQELFLPWYFLIECLMSWQLGMMILLFDNLNFLNGSFQLPLTNIRLCSKQSNFFFQLQQFTFQFVLFVLFFLEFCHQLLINYLKLLILLLQDKRLTCGLFQKQLLLIQ